MFSGAAMFCTNCGLKSGDVSIHFCPGCGNPLKSETLVGRQSSPPSTLNPLLNSLKTPFKQRRILVAFGAAALVVGVVLVLSALTPFKLDAAEAKARLMSTTSFSFEMVLSKESEPISGSANPIFGVGDGCVQDIAFKKLLSQGEVLASTDLTTDLDNAKSSSFHEDLIKFESETDATEAINLVREGYANSECGFSGEYINTELSGLTTAQDEFGAGGSASASFKNDMRVQSAYLNLDFTFSGNNTYVQRGQYLLVIETDRTLPGADRTASQIKEATTQAIKKMFG
jgi:hypothetical protein